MLEQTSLEIQNSIGKKFLTTLIFGLEFSSLLLLLGNGGNIPWFPPVFVFFLKNAKSPEKKVHLTKQFQLWKKPKQEETREYFPHCQAVIIMLKTQVQKLEL